MNWRDLGRTMAKLGLPTLGGALAGPAGAAAGKVIADALGADASPDAVQAALAGHPDALVRLREVEADMAAREAEHEERMAEIATADVQHARSSGRDDAVRRWLVWPAVILPVAFAAYILIANPPDPSGVGMYMLGVLTGVLVQVYGFFFGTSIGSSKRAEEISRMKG